VTIASVRSASARLASKPLPPRAAPVRRTRAAGRTGAARLLYIDKQTAGKIAVENGGALPRISNMQLHCPVLVVGEGVSTFEAEHVGAALRARGVRGYWLVEKQPRARPVGSGVLAETLIGFAGLHIERIASLDDL